MQIKDGVFINNKSSRAGLSVTCEEDFAEHMALMNTNPHWADMVGKEPTVSVFDVSKYLTSVLARLEKENHVDVVPFLEKAIAEFNAQQALLDLAANDLEKLAA